MSSPIFVSIVFLVEPFLYSVDFSVSISANIISNDLKSLVGEMIIPDKSVKIEFYDLPDPLFPDK